MSRAVDAGTGEAVELVQFIPDELARPGDSVRAKDGSWRDVLGRAWDGTPGVVLVLGPPRAAIATPQPIEKKKGR